MDVIDIYCGAGGMSKGFEMAGFNIILGIDCWPIAVRSFRENHPNSEILCRDIREIKTLPKADVVIGGPPCPNFSRINLKRDPRKGLKLVYEFLRCVKLVKPKYWVMENVPLISKYLSKREFPTIQILNSADFGVPQNRRRCFLGNYIIPRKTRRNPITLREALEGLPKEEYKYFSEYATKKAYIDKKKEKEKGFVFGLRILDLDKPSVTIISHLSKGFPTSDPVFLDDQGRMRLPTINECKRIQSFPDNYFFFGNKKEQYIQIGNAVPPLLSKAIAKAILRGKRTLSEVFL